MQLDGERSAPEPPGSIPAEELLASGPPPLRLPEARATIRARLRSTGTKVVVLDDDPTGSQSVQRVPVLTRWNEDDLRWAFTQPSSVFFVLTNTRSRSESDTATVLHEVLEALHNAASATGQRYMIISRGDSTLRGHYPLETDVISAVASGHGRSYDALLLAPAYPLAGRVTAGDAHYARMGDVFVPVAVTDYATDSTFGFRSSNLRNYVQEKTEGRVAAESVVSLTLEDIRVGGPQRIKDILTSCRHMTPVVANAVHEADLEVVALGAHAAEESGARILYRTGPSFVPVRAGLEARSPVGHREIFQDGTDSGHGLVVVGSHVDLTGRQIQRLLELPGTASFELDVPGVLDDARRDDVLRQTGEGMVSALAHSDVVLMTSRARVTGDSAESSLAIARRVSAALVELVRHAQREQVLRWVVAKGGITSNDVATAGLGIRRAWVVGQLFPGVVSVWLTATRDHHREPGGGMPYVVFPGNVGDDLSLREAVRILRGEQRL